jgi:hypothetical protein
MSGQQRVIEKVISVLHTLSSRSLLSYVADWAQLNITEERNPTIEQQAFHHEPGQVDATHGADYVKENRLSVYCVSRVTTSCPGVKSPQ